MQTRARRLSEAASTFRVYFLAAVFVPALLCAVAAWRDDVAIEQSAQREAAKLMSVVQERAERLLKGHNRFLDLIVSRLRDQDWSTLRSSPDLLHELETVDSLLDDPPALLLVDANGDSWQAARRQQDNQPALSSDRGCFLALQRKEIRTCIGQPYVDRLSGKNLFPLARSLEKDGVFNGMAQVAVAADAIVSPWALAMPHTADTVALSRGDGAILAQSASLTQGRRGLGDSTIPPLGDAAAAANIVTSAQTSGGASDLNMISAPIAGYPANVIMVLDRNAILASWYRDVMIYGLAAAAASAAIVLALGIALRRTRDAALATVRWRHEKQAQETTQEQLWQSQKMESLGKLTSGIAHDFNNLLTVIVGNLGMLERSAVEPNRKRQLRQALKAADTATELARQLLTFARKQVPRPRPVDLVHLFDDLEGLLVRTLGKDIRLLIDTDPALWPVVIDPTQLELIILNVTINARDAMPDGGRLAISLCNRDFAQQAPQELAPGQYVVLTVADTGIGMSPATLARATEPFFTTKGPGKGTGLGLSMMQGVVAQLGGATRLRSTPGAGTDVEIWLPRTHLMPDAIVMRGRAAQPRPCGQTILVCDDSPTVLEFVGDALKEDGYHVIAVDNAASALAALRDSAPVSLLVLEAAMPKMNGVTATQQIRTCHPKLPILLINGSADCNATQIEASETPVLRKPFTQEQLTTCIRELLQRAPSDTFERQAMTSP